MAFCVDLANPSVWAFAQDVGGRNVGASLGWGNMLGNFGAAIAPVALQFVRKQVNNQTNDGILAWNVAFFLCAGSFVLASLCGLCLNAMIPVERAPEPEAEDYRDA